jgi:predicted dehydrogenase
MPQKPTKNSPLKVGIIGCGQIGSLWDETQPDPSFPKTHAYTVTLLDSLKLIGLCEQDINRLNAAQAAWKPEVASTRLEDLLAREIDILAIATPTNLLRYNLVQSAVTNKVPFILCEKPVSIDLEEAKKIQKILNQSKTQLIVNYIRRHDKALQRVKKIINDGVLGNPQKVVCHYGKGLSNNGSHILDLLIWFFGLPESVLALSETPDEWKENDPTLDCVLNYKNFQTYLISEDYNNYSCIEIDLLFTKGRIKINNSGRSIQIFTVKPDPDFPDYNNLQLQECIEDGLKQTMPQAYQAIIELNNSGKIDHVHTIEDSVQLLTIIEKIKESFKEKKQIDIKKGDFI